MKRIAAVILSVLILAGLFGCAEPPAAIATNEKTTGPSDANQTVPVKLNEGNGDFAFDLYTKLKDTGGNLFYSPYSISAALAMTWAGASGETEKQMADVLHFTLPQEQLHPAFRSLASELAGRGDDTADQDDKGFILRNANALWGQQGYQFVPEFIDNLSQNYDAGMKTLDFAKNAEKSRVVINDWVSEQTEDKINDLIPPGGVDLMTRLVLTNAIYFKANWFYQFNSDFTRDGDFNLLNGTTTTVKMMKQTEYFNYTSGDGYQAVELPYQGNKLSMLVLLPEKGEFPAFENTISSAKVRDIIGNLEQEKVALTMPKFEFTSDFQSAEILKAMGMTDAFSSAADFSGISEEEKIWIDEVIHKAFVAVDENGTEAAAATAVIMVGLPTSSLPIEFTMDRPFIFLIRDIETGTDTVRWPGNAAVN